jgi:hypothetical protein
MQCVRWAWLPLLLMASLGNGRLVSAPQAGAPQNQGRSLADSIWRGAIGDAAKGNSPAQLRMVLQNGNLTGILTYDGYEETLTITVSAPVSTKVSAPAAIRMKGVSFRDLQHSGRNFILDTFSGEVSPDGGQIRGAAVDAQGTRSRWEFARVNGK